MRFLKRHPEIWFVLAILVLAGIAGEADYQDELQAQRAYCEKVHNGAWPDYNRNYDEICYDGLPVDPD